MFPPIQTLPGTPTPGDLCTPEQLKTWHKNWRATEAHAAQTGTGYCVFSLQSDCLLYTSELFAHITGIELPFGEYAPLELWLKQLPSCDGQQENLVRPMLIKLIRLYMLQSQTSLVIDYGRETRQGFRRLEETIVPFGISQSHPRHLFWCWTHPVDHLNTRFAYSLTLLENGHVTDKRHWCPPLKSHPLLQDLSPTELKVLQQLLHTEKSHLIADTLNLGTETVKTHRRNIIRKTGFHSTDALVAVLKNDMME